MQLQPFKLLLVSSLAGTSTALYYCNDVGLYLFENSGYQISLPFYGSTANCILNQGAQSDAVKALQENLNACYPIGIKSVNDNKLLVEDGDFGAKTTKALRYVQGYVKASVDGEYGLETQDKMDWFGIKVTTSRCATIREFNAL